MSIQSIDAVFHRDLNKYYPIITHGDGVYLYDQTGKSYLDGCSGAVAANLGHSNEKIAKAMYEQAMKVGFVHTMRFETTVLHELSRKIVKLAPTNLSKVYFTSGGSEANESAIKLARQYHKDRGKGSKHIVIGRWQSYHGNTLGSLSIGGDVKRRQLYAPNLIYSQHVHSPYCHRCPYYREKKECIQQENWSCVKDIENRILEIGADNISAIMMEPIVGSQQGAVVPPTGYFEQVRKLCDKHDILLIIDEVMTGFGRTGKHFAIEHFNIEPDIITFGKGVSAGYAPLAGMIVSDKLIDGIIENSNGKFVHGYTYSGHPVSVAAGLATLEIYEDQKVVENCEEMSCYLFESLEVVKRSSSLISEIRGEGLLIGIELVRDREQDVLFDPVEQASAKINDIAIDLGAVFYPGSGGINGIEGEHIIISPPLTITKPEVDSLVSIFQEAINIFENQIKEKEEGMRVK